MKKNRRYRHIIIGGTFDHLHTGHEEFLHRAFALAHKVSIGVTSDEFTRNKRYAVAIEPYDTRLANLQNALKKYGYASQAVIFRIHDIYGTSIRDNSLDAILVTPDTYANAIQINKKRRERGLRTLKITSIPFVKAEDRKIITSTRIRSGQINREGYIYKYIYKGKHKLMLPARMRMLMRRPTGKIFKGDEKNLLKAAEEIKKNILQTQPTMVIAVGDIVSYSLQKVGYKPDIMVIDLRSQRQKVRNRVPAGEFAIHVNPAGTVTETASESILKAVALTATSKKKIVIRVIGEEDLLTLISILHAPLGSYVIYGQRHLGAIIEEVTEEKKEYVVELLRKFHSSAS